MVCLESGIDSDIVIFIIEANEFLHFIKNQNFYRQLIYTILSILNSIFLNISATFHINHIPSITSYSTIKSLVLYRKNMVS